MNARTLPLHVVQAEQPEIRGGAALRTHLKPLQRWLETDAVTEISVNGPAEIWIARQGEAYMERHAAEDLTADVLLELARQVATSTDQEVSREKPLLSAELAERLSSPVRAAAGGRPACRSFHPQAGRPRFDPRRLRTQGRIRPDQPPDPRRRGERARLAD